jgi:hypothetical protein
MEELIQKIIVYDYPDLKQKGISPCFLCQFIEDLKKFFNITCSIGNVLLFLLHSNDFVGFRPDDS